jgi:hypothetical protein
MSTLSLMCRKKYSSPGAGGGVHGKDVGTDHGIMTEDGAITGELPAFTEIYIRAGEMITGVIVGEDNHGIISAYLIMT